jgi:hypothetical protein
MFAATETLAFYKSPCIDDRRPVGQPLSEAVNALLVADRGGIVVLLRSLRVGRHSHQSSSPTNNNMEAHVKFCSLSVEW